MVQDNCLSRSRSPVRLWYAVPKQPQKGCFCCFYVGNLYLLRPDFTLQGVQSFCWILQTMLIAISASTLSKQLLDTIKRYFILWKALDANIGIIGHKHLKFGSHRAETDWHARIWKTITDSISPQHHIAYNRLNDKQ